ncbi:MAG: AAA family ATPase [Chloroflexota bacterium]|nr:AAA family ATPase [Chloroflexota bacterium]
MLKVTAKDFGPIVEGTVKLKPLTIFVGPSNTGKSYMATLIYALMQAFRGPEKFSRLSTGRVYVPRNALEREAVQQSSEHIGRWINDLDYWERESRPFHYDDLPEEIRALLFDTVLAQLRSGSVSFGREIQRCQGEIPQLRRRSVNSSEILIELLQEEPSLSIAMAESRRVNDNLHTQAFECHFVGSPFDSMVFGDDLVGDLIESIEGHDRFGGDVHDAYRDFLIELIELVMTHLLKVSPPKSFYLPAARSGIAQGHRIIASVLIRQSPFAGIQRMEVPQFSGLIADFMGHLLTIGQKRGMTTDSSLSEMTSFLEQEVVRGKIYLHESGLPYPEIYYEPYGCESVIGRFALNQTSSMVSELAPIILFLKHLVSPGDLLILEEPESHLHPAAQRQMARAIVRLVNAGVKMLITTHSDYFLNQINNLLRISHANEQWLEEHGFQKSDCLQREDVSAYLFRWDDDQGGSLIDELTIRPDVGIDDDEFGKVVNDQYEETMLVEGIPLK